MQTRLEDFWAVPSAELPPPEQSLQLRAQGGRKHAPRSVPVALKILTALTTQRSSVQLMRKNCEAEWGTLIQLPQKSIADSIYIGTVPRQG